MKQDSFSNRLKLAMQKNCFKQIDVVNRSENKIDKSLLNKYLNGVSEAGNDKLSILADVLNVNEVWLMGYDVPMNQMAFKEDKTKPKRDNYNDFSELDQILFSKTKDLTDDEKRTVINIVDAIKKDIDKDNI